MESKFHTFAQPIQSIPLPERFTYPFHYTPHPLCVIAAEETQAYQKERAADDILLQPPVGCHTVKLALLVAAEDNAILHIHRLEQALHLLLDGGQSIFHLLFIGSPPRLHFQNTHISSPSHTAHRPRCHRPRGTHPAHSTLPAAPAAPCSGK